MKVKCVNVAMRLLNGVGQHLRSLAAPGPSAVEDIEAAPEDTVEEATRTATDRVRRMLHLR